MDTTRKVLLWVLVVVGIVLVVGFVLKLLKWAIIVAVIAGGGIYLWKHLSRHV